ncbi:MAG: antitoxin [Actinobacteria bacterium]|nr:antitoxin [Actinomycetota bacterium]
MRTTIDLPDDLHAVIRQLAHDRHEPLSRVAVDLMRRSLEAGTTHDLVIGPRGLPIAFVGHPVTPEDVASLDDD